MAISNELYLAVLPVIHITPNQVTGFGLTEELLTLLSDEKFATSFFPNEVDGYIDLVKNREKYLIGSHVTGYEYHKKPTADGRVIVRVVQHVA
jgi:hypothetical protein